MKLLRISLILTLIVFTLSLHLPKATFAGEESAPVKTEITQHTPEVLSTPEEVLPTPPPSWWHWFPEHPIMSGLLCGGVAYGAYLLFKPDPDPNKDDGHGNDGPGDITVEW